MKFIFASNNKHKVEELRNKFLSLKSTFPVEIVTLQDIGFNEEIPETQPTIEGNALQKAHYVYERFKIPCIADDTGLEITALNGEPGVYSARYAGENKSFEDNMNLVLKNMENCENRTASFKTIIAMIINDKEYLFEGIVEGEILKEKHGSEGFGYDPIFRPKGFTKTFAEMSLNEKNTISHRARAIDKMAEFLKTMEL